MINTLMIQTMINGIAIEPNFKNSNGFNEYPRQIIPSFRDILLSKVYSK